MSAPAYTPELQASYQKLFDTCVIATDKLPFVDAAVKTITASRARYEAVSAETKVPWYFIGIAHNMEGGSKFTVHIHNGDPLTARTVHVPAGRPVSGNPPFAWEFSAADALAYTGMTKWTDWSLPGILYKLEGYNGYGYRSKGINTPYLWSFTNQYKSGKYVADGQYDPNAVSKQCGAAAILHRLVENKIVTFAKVDNSALLAQIRQVGDQVMYLPSQYVALAEQLQNLLKQNGANIGVDGKAGKNTSDAYYAITKQYLKGDPRKV